jgi:ribosomal-protein-alanine N-acetyltransferase
MPDRATTATTLLALRFRPITIGDALAASRWRYPGEYSIYNLGLTPLLSSAIFRATLRLAGVYSLAVDTPTERLISVFSLIRRGSDVELGVGMRPDLMDHGLGVELMLQGMDYARRRLPSVETFSLDVATFNKRAITVYSRAGFQPGQIHPFYFGRQRYESMRMNRPA